jgi:Crp-like helix-turn-helix domain
LLAMPPSNRLLALLASRDRKGLLSQCENVALHVNQILHSSEEVMEYAYFPTSCSVSLLMPCLGRADMYLAMVGNEGMLGLPLLLGVPYAPFASIVQFAGQAWRIAASKLQVEVVNSQALKQKLNQYFFVCFHQLALRTVCNRLHSLEQRLAALLLLMSDCNHALSFSITQETLANMLAVRRVGVSKAASEMQSRHIIDYSRGHLTILDSAALAHLACQCYAAQKQAYKQMLPD